MLDYTIFNIYTFNKILSRVFAFFVPAATNRFETFGINSWMSNAAYLNVFGISLVAAYFMTKKCKNWLSILMIIMLAFSISPILSSVYNFMTEYYTRFIYATVLFMVVASVRYFEVYDKKTFKPALIFAVGGFVLITIFYYLGSRLTYHHMFNQVFSRFERPEFEVSEMYRYFAIIAAAVMYILLILFYKNKFINKRIISVIVVITVLYGCAYTYINTYSGCLLSYDKESKITLKDQVDIYIGEKPVLEDSEDYRIDTSLQCRNYASVFNKSSLTTFESLRNKSAEEFAKYSGADCGAVSTSYSTTDNETRTLLGAKYYINLFNKDELKLPDGFELSGNSNGYDIYENKNYIGRGFSYDNYILKSEFEKLYADRTDASAFLLNTLVVNDEDEPFVSGVMSHGISDGVSDRISVTEMKENSDGFTAKINSDRDRIIFMSVPYEEVGWSGKINGKDIDFINANIGFMAFKVGSGENEISFTYKYPTRTGGYLISLSFVIMSFMFAYISKKKKFYI